MMVTRAMQNSSSHDSSNYQRKLQDLHIFSQAYSVQLTTPQLFQEITFTSAYSFCTIMFSILD